MNFIKVIEAVTSQLDAADVRYALIGGFAMALRGVQRATGDWADIRMMLETCSQSGETLDWELLEDYLDLFGLDDNLEEMKDWYGATQ